MVDPSKYTIPIPEPIHNGIEYRDQEVWRLNLGNCYNQYLRVTTLINPPYMTKEKAREWLQSRRKRYDPISIQFLDYQAPNIFWLCKIDSSG